MFCVALIAVCWDFYFGAVSKDYARLARWCDLDVLAKSTQGCSIKVLAEGGVLDGFLKPGEFGFDTVAALNFYLSCFVGGNGFTLAGFELGDALLVVVLILGVMSVAGDGLVDEPGSYLDFTCLL